MILTTTPDVPGRTITRTLGLVRGATIRARHVGSDVVAVMRNLTGGEILEYTKMLAVAREEAIDRLEAEARALGADAVVALRFETSTVMRGAAELMCYGTAVKLAAEDGDA